jgi:hypothetical protein
MTTQLERDVADHTRAEQAELAKRLGPGETPKREADIIAADGSRRHGAWSGTVSLEEAEALGNPIIPYDQTGHKMHPADAYGGLLRPDGRLASGFGGSGQGVQADQRTLTAGERVTEHVDPTTGELVRTLHAADGQVLDQQREPGPGLHPHAQGVMHEDPRARGVAEPQHGADGKDYTVREAIDPITGELVRTKLSLNGEVLDQQREPGPNQHRNRGFAEQNGPVL